MTTDNESMVMRGDEILKQYDELVPEKAAASVSRKTEQDMADSIARLISKEIEKNPGNSRAVLLGISAALMVMTAQNINLATTLARTIETSEQAMVYGLGAAKRELFMIGGWVMFGCAVVAKLAGWL